MSTIKLLFFNFKIDLVHVKHLKKIKINKEEPQKTYCFSCTCFKYIVSTLYKVENYLLHDICTTKTMVFFESKIIN